MRALKVEMIHSWLLERLPIWKFCHLDILVSRFVILLFIEVYGNNVSVNFSISTYISNSHLLFYYIAHKDILSSSLMFMEGKNFLSSKKLPLSSSSL